MKTLLITGVSGFIGSYLARFFLKEGMRIIGIDTTSNKNARPEDVTKFFSVKLPDKSFNDILISERPDIIIHCAGRSSVGMSIDEPLADYYSGPVLTIEVLESIRLFRPKCRFIFISSAAVYGDLKKLPINEEFETLPISPYGFHKLQSEIIIQEYTRIYNISTAIVRIFSAYGPGLFRQVIWDICNKIKSKKELVLKGTGKESRDFIHVADIVKGIDIVLRSSSMKGEVYNLGSGTETTIAALVDLILKTFSSNIKPLFDGMNKGIDPLNWCADIRKINSIGFSPSIKLEDGIKSFVDYLNQE